MHFSPLPYLDPGSGSFFIQIAIAVLLGLAVLLRESWGSIKKFFSDKFMSEGHTHSHSHFGNTAAQTIDRITLSLGLTVALLIVEIMAGIFGNSLALLTDAAHNFTDVIALGLSWYALDLAAQPANAGKTYGYHRVGILVAVFNSTTLILIALGIFYAAWHRLMTPLEVNSPILISVGIIAFLVNLGTALLVQSGSEFDLNLRSTFLHLMGDALTTLAAVFAGIIIFLGSWYLINTNWNWLDPVISVMIGTFIFYNAWDILRQTILILLESTPESIDLDSMIGDLLKVDGVYGVHDLHVWSINENLRALSAHIITDDIHVSAWASIQRDLNEVLAHKYNIDHATLQIECEGHHENILFCNMSEHQHEHAN